MNTQKLEGSSPVAPCIMDGFIVYDKCVLYYCRYTRSRYIYIHICAILYLSFCYLSKTCTKTVSSINDFCKILYRSSTRCSRCRGGWSYVSKKIFKKCLSRTNLYRTNKRITLLMQVAAHHPKTQKTCKNFRFTHISYIFDV